MALVINTENKLTAEFPHLQKFLLECFQNIPDRHIYLKFYPPYINNGNHNVHRQFLHHTLHFIPHLPAPQIQEAENSQEGPQLYIHTPRAPPQRRARLRVRVQAGPVLRGDEVHPRVRDLLSVHEHAREDLQGVRRARARHLRGQPRHEDRERRGVLQGKVYLRPR